MKLTDIVEELNERGFERQAVLLQSKFKYSYTLALMQKRWRSSVESQIGTDLYQALMNSDLCQSLLSSSNRDHSAGKNIFDNEKKPSRDFQVPLLEVSITQNFSIECLVASEQIETNMIQLLDQADKIIYAEVKELTADNDDLLLRIYRDEDVIVNEANLSDQKKMQNSASIIKSYSKRISEVRALGLPHSVMLVHIKPLQEYLPLNPFDSNDASPGNVEKICDYANQVLSDEDLHRQNISRRSELLLEQHDTRVISNAKINITEALRELYEYGIDGHLSYDYIDMMVSSSDSNVTGVNQTNYHQKLLKTDLKFREDILRNFQDEIRIKQRSLMGIKQIIAGSQATNSHVGEFSTKQNDGRFPNLQYSKASKDALQQIADEMDQLFDKLPDIGDLAVPRKLRNRGTLSYMVEELDYDPMDVTFGNEAGCCIFVPKEKSKIQNGYSVPVYLLEKQIKLFGVYRLDGEKKRRMGLVLAFDTIDLVNIVPVSFSDDPKDVQQVGASVLAANSLELSRTGIAGGKETILAITNYVEEWLSGYAEHHSYHAAVMGNHQYNTSVNHSSRSQDLFTHPVMYAGRSSDFYNEIFKAPFQSPVMTQFGTGKSLISQKDRLYTLWQKE